VYRHPEVGTVLSLFCPEAGLHKKQINFGMGDYTQMLTKMHEYVVEDQIPAGKRRRMNISDLRS
jgi:hypothetical protein